MALRALVKNLAIIIGGAVLVLSRAASASELAVGILPVVVLLVANFYLHGRYLMERPANAVLTLAACGLDLLLVAALFLNWRGTGALENPMFVFLYPLVFTSSTAVKPVTLGVVTDLVRGDLFYWGSLMAGALLAGLPVAILFNYFLDDFVEGITAGSTK